LCRELQPDCLVCGRLGNALGDYASAGDNKIPGQLVEADWETPATINDTWGFKSDDHHWKSPREMIHKLVDITSKGGNYLLNVGPTAEGVIPQPSIERLLAIGDWLKVNGESIYGTRPGPLQDLAWGRTTARPGKVYLHVFDWPEGGQIDLPDLPVSKAYLLADPDQVTLPLSREGSRLMIRGVDIAPDDIDTVIVLSE
jgi:alpha-L-fucosidase